MIKVLINADDYGIAENQTEAILQSFRIGLITSTTIMVNMPDYSRAISRAKEEGVFGKIGLHLNLTQGEPLTDPIRHCHRFCGPDGFFHGNFHSSKLCRLFLSREEKCAVAIESEAQMETYLNTGFPLKHLDSHHHSHTDPSIAHIVLPIAKRMGFRSVRLSRNIPRPGYGLMKKIYKWYFNSRVQKLKFFHTDFFGSVEDFRHVRSHFPPNSSVELMVHPSLQKDGRLDLAGKLMDFRTPMSLLAETLVQYGGMIRLAMYEEIY